MKTTTVKIFFGLGLILMTSLIFMACEQPTATVSELGKPLPTTPPSTPTPVVSPTPTPKIDPRRTDLERVVVGKVAPDFTLEDLNQNKIKLSSFRGKQNVLLVFYRGYF